MRGKVVTVARDVDTGRAMVTFLMSEIRTADFDRLKHPDLDIEVKKHRERRSLDANAYFHVLVQKLADAHGLSKARCKTLMITRYGQMERTDEGTPVIIKTNLPPETMLELEYLHCCPVRFDDNATFYQVYRGSHTYDTKEMSILIDGVVEECKQSGIETMPPKDIERMVMTWIP